MERSILRPVVISVLLAFTVAACGGGRDDTGESPHRNTPEDSARGECDPNYTPCVPIDSDVDCAGGRGNGPSYVMGPVHVVGVVVYGLDGDGDGVGCGN